jgi:hypothetical protein
MNVPESETRCNNRRRGEASQLNGLALAAGPSRGDLTRNWGRSMESGLSLREDIGRQRLPGAPGSRQRRVGGYAAAAKKEHGDQRPCAVKAEGPAGDHSQLVVKPLGHTIGELGFDVGEDTVFVFADRAGRLDEWFELGAGGPGEPPVQSFLGRLDGRLVEDVGEGFLEQVGAVERCIVFLNGAELVPLLGAEVPGSPEQHEAGLLDRRGLVGTVDIYQTADHRSSDLIDGLGSELEDMEEIEDDLCLRGLVLDRLYKGGGHVDGDGFEFPGPLFSEFVEESVERFGAFSLGGPDDALPVVVYDDGDVSMPFSVAELVDADATEVFEPFGIELVGNDTLDDLADRPPGDSHHSGDFGLVCDLCKVGGHFLERSGETAVRPGPGNLLDVDTAGGAFHASRRVFEDDPGCANVEVDPPSPLGPVIIAGTSLAAAGTSGFSPRWLHAEYDGEALEGDICDDSSGNPDEYSGKLGDAHCFPFSFWGLGKHQKVRKTVRISIFRSYFDEKSGRRRLRRSPGGVGDPLLMQESLFFDVAISVFSRAGKGVPTPERNNRIG